MPETGRTFSESWYRIAGLKVSLHPTVTVRKQRFRGETWYMLRDPFNNLYFRLPPDTNVNTACVMDFLEHLQRQLRCPIVLIWDRFQAHLGQLINHCVVRRQLS